MIENSRFDDELELYESVDYQSGTDAPRTATFTFANTASAEKDVDDILVYVTNEFSIDLKNKKCIITSGQYNYKPKEVIDNPDKKTYKPNTAKLEFTVPQNTATLTNLKKIVEGDVISIIGNGDLKKYSLKDGAYVSIGKLDWRAKAVNGLKISVNKNATNKILLIPIVPSLLPPFYEPLESFKQEYVLKNSTAREVYDFINQLPLDEKEFEASYEIDNEYEYEYEVSDTDVKFITDIFDYLLGLQPVDVDPKMAEFAAKLLYEVWDKVYFINVLSKLPEPKNKKNPGEEYIKRSDVRDYWYSHKKDIGQKERKAINEIVNNYSIEYDKKFKRREYTLKEIQKENEYVYKILEFFFPENISSFKSIWSEKLVAFAIAIYCEAVEESRVMNMIPRPPDDIRTIIKLASNPSKIVGWLISEAIKSFWAYATKKDVGIFLAVKNKIKANNKPLLRNFIGDVVEEFEPNNLNNNNMENNYYLETDEEYTDEYEDYEDDAYEDDEYDEFEDYEDDEYEDYEDYEDNEAEEQFAERLGELANESFESEYELEAELDNELEAMQEAYFEAPLKEEHKKRKRRRRRPRGRHGRHKRKKGKGLFGKILKAGAGVLGKVVGATPIGSLVKAGADLVTGDFKGMAKNIAKGAMGLAPIPGLGAVGGAVMDAVVPDGGGEGEVRRRRRRVARRVAKITRDGFKELRDNLPDDLEDREAVYEASRDAMHRAMAKNGVQPQRPVQRKEQRPVHRKENDFNDKRVERRNIWLKPGERVVIIRPKNGQ